ncbi:MAG: Fe-S cluster assembly ATPase SufC [Candidatus Magasanikbacteria bacterium CG10_big_fil_rev_8_21_14_0_10_47_10]|uniref:Fe-S cluster assembly ATPase SufC n=1 Tax=Candidatus Magasanikbacteria bacterium CG10_big_fil_rev_8_21_14_0_10_47_10 TaxID=1974652 RepID=A0A2H0TRE0_9BACT|nr:MAG: Fe-S cluster assembly ATPase SufC [Candidatus Magasanikbacteria bacterium CG10_big_fil_rev_8_21_14_0_10_47_10]
MLQMQNLHISVEGKKIVKGIDLVVPAGEVHAIMGPNGAGKSTLANVLGGHPKYQITQGSITLDTDELKDLSPDERAKKGLFLSMQYIPEIAGVSIANFLRLAYNSVKGEKVNPLTFHEVLAKKVKQLDLDEDFLKRSLGVGLSGGEKKKLEVLQLLVLEPSFAVLDETDSGLDVDALKVVAGGINQFHNPDRGVLLITHYNRLLDYVEPDRVHIMKDGRIVQSGGKELAKNIEKEGYNVIPANAQIPMEKNS